MLTVDYDRLGLGPGELLLDLGCGFGRHAYEGLRRGASVVACDIAVAELRETIAIGAAMDEADEIPPGVLLHVACADATALPFADGTFDRIVASEVLEHVPDDRAAMAELYRVLRPGGTIAVTVPAWLAERGCWLLSSDYHAPAVEGGHLRIYTESALRTRLRDVGLTPGRVHHAHALHTPYWWLRCAVGPDNDSHPLVRAYHRLLSWDIERQPAVTRVVEKALNPVLGKSIVIYSNRPASGSPRVAA